uniref:Uncharacterized protein n=1 Tax=Pipistrellus kuhlii TaxID=59472 RepID=A0A7J7ZKL5_PIPKU|nr:hypothetical protein mPipKuh1_009483 [Pipistrellus kuhlii]
MTSKLIKSLNSLKSHAARNRGGTLVPSFLGSFRKSKSLVLADASKCGSWALALGTSVWGWRGGERGEGSIGGREEKRGNGSGKCSHILFFKISLLIKVSHICPHTPPPPSIPIPNSSPRMPHPLLSMTTG